MHSLYAFSISWRDANSARTSRPVRVSVTSRASTPSTPSNFVKQLLDSFLLLQLPLHQLFFGALMDRSHSLHVHGAHRVSAAHLHVLNQAEQEGVAFFRI